MADSVQIHSESDIFLVLSHIRPILEARGFSASDIQKVLVGISELTRNILDHANRCGSIWWLIADDEIRIRVSDNGPGIHNPQEIVNCMERVPDARGLGLGLAGTKRLMDEFKIESSERGTCIYATKRRTRKHSR